MTKSSWNNYNQALSLQLEMGKKMIKVPPIVWWKLVTGLFWSLAQNFNGEFESN